MKFLTSRELSDKWGIGQCRIIKLAREGRIEGACMYGKTWIFPENAVKPSDHRRKAYRNGSSPVPDDNETDTFRYPISGFRDISGFNPPFSREERQLNDAVLLFYACRFDEADRLLGVLPETAVNRYCRIGALYVGCMLDMTICNTRRFSDRYTRLSSELKEDFPHRPEMYCLLRELDVTLGADGYFKNNFRLSPGYNYHKSFLPHLAALCALSLSYSDISEISEVAMASFESACLFLENSGCYFDLQVQHFYLGVTYSYMRNTDMAFIHFKRALVLAEKYELYYCLAIEYFYMKDMLEPALSEFPEAFRQHLRCLSESVRGRFLAFINAASMNSFYKLLPSRDFLYAFYAVHGYTNKEIADILNKKPSAVGMRFDSIYTALGIDGKKELIQLYESSTGKSILS